MKRKPNAVLSFVDCLDYDDYSDLLDEVLTFAAEMLDFKLTNDEIESYASWYLTVDAEEQGYSKENYDETVIKLQDFAKDYCFKIKKGKKK